MTEKEYFYRLSPDLVLDAVEKAGLVPSSQCTPLNSLENRVYSVVLEDGRTVVAKFYRPGRWSKEQILEEHEFLLELDRNELPVCEPLFFPDGSTLKEIDGIYFGLWPLTGGREPFAFTEEELPVMGRLLAQIHNCGALRIPKYRAPFTSRRLIGDSLEAIALSNTIPADLLIRYHHLAEKIAEAYDQLSELVPMIRIHGDCHLGNLLQRPNGWSILDFDDFCLGPAVQDFWMLLQNQQQYDYHLQLFLDGYRQFREFEDSWLILVEPLRAMRYIYYAGWIAKRWADPSFKNAFPHFGSADYWRDEINDLEKQYQKFGNGYARETNVLNPSEELSNKDFFFDWED